MSLRSLHAAWRDWLYANKSDEPLVDEKIRKKTHELSNEATKLQSSLRRIADAPDPVDELARTMRGEPRWNSSH